jgi:tRNA nucleotidyltransferase (CCA-adding enzyme)
MNDTLIDVCLAIQAAGGRALLVGGSVRDMHLGVKSKDLDVEVYGLELEELEQSLSTWGAFKKVGRRFGVLKMRIEDLDFDFSMPRTENKVGAGHKGFIPTFHKDMDPKDAARRRDYTINSMYFDPLTGELGDPYAGRHDLAEGWLRATNYASFIEDPTRVLRGMQFCGRFGLRPSAGTKAACVKMIGQHDEIAPEMVWVEWEKWARKSTKPSMGLDFLRQTGWLMHYPELCNLINCPQHPIHHPEGDVWEHTLQVVDQLAGKGVVEVLAGLCHDMGKPKTTVGGGTDVTSYGHDQEGASEAGWFLDRIGAPERIKAQVIPLVANHMFSAHHNRVSQRTVRRLAVRLEPASITQLSHVILADRMGRSNTRSTGYCMRCGKELTNPDSIERGIGPVCLAKWQIPQVLTIAQEIECENAKPKGILMGRHLLKWQYMASGPGMGNFLRFAFERQLDGAFDDLQGARLFAYNVLKADRPSSDRDDWYIWLEKNT